MGYVTPAQSLWGRALDYGALNGGQVGGEPMRCLRMCLQLAGYLAS
jgi:hypothetical protein